MDCIDEMCQIENKMPIWVKLNKNGSTLDKVSWPIICKDTKEIIHNYRDYLQSNHWQIFRKRFYSSKYFKSKSIRGGINGKCICCQQENKKMDLHHLTYRRIGDEKISDIVPVCRECHSKTHDNLKLNPGQRDKSWKRVRKQFKK